MALLLAPYQPSMRLGCGFNTYTHQICVDNAVIHEDFGQNDLVQTAIKPLLADAPEVAQSVIFKTEVIEKMSDLTESLDINGALNIKAANIANARGNGTFVNSNVIKESDMNFLITCKVVNQAIHDTALTKFNPLTNSNPSNFTEIFGDSFISGFQVGGEFTALISIKVHDKEQLESITAQATIAFTTPGFVSKDKTLAESGKAGSEGGADIQTGGGVNESGDISATKKTPSAGESPSKGVSIDADAKIQKVRTDIMAQNTVTISVSWTGGGQHLKNPEDDWNFETLRAAAIKFPELVAKTPVMTHAVLTKYSALRSYHAHLGKANTSAPASYENAGIFTTMLQDAYLDYKNLYKDLQLLGMDVDAGKMELVMNDSQLLRDSVGRSESNQPHEGKKPQTELIPQPTSTKAESVASEGEIVGAEESDDANGTTPANAITKDKRHEVTQRKPPSKTFEITKPYPASLMGLELAKRDIRVNMSRILIEVDWIASNPDEAMNEFKENSFMSPLIFKQYVPKGKLRGDFPPMMITA